MIGIISYVRYALSSVLTAKYIYNVQVVNYSDSGSAEEICELSSKIITFLDLAGHQKYLKTTIFGLTGHIPDFAMLVIAANAGVGMSYNL